MENRLFRKETIDRISSPEQLQDYMKVTNPGIWMVLSAVIALLVGLIILASTRNIETLLPVQAVANEGVVTIALPEGNASGVREGMILRIAGQEIPIDYIYDDEGGQPTVSAKMDLPDGQYDAQIVTESIRPITFLLKS